MKQEDLDEYARREHRAAINTIRGCFGWPLFIAALLGVLFMYACEAKAQAQTCLSDSTYNWECRGGSSNHCNPGSLFSSGASPTGYWQTYYAGAGEDGLGGTPIVQCGEYLAGQEYRVHFREVQGTDSGYVTWQEAYSDPLSHLIEGVVEPHTHTNQGWVHRHKETVPPEDIELPLRLLHPCEEELDDCGGGGDPGENNEDWDYYSIPNVNGGFWPASSTRFVNPVGYGDDRDYYGRRSYWRGAISCLVLQPDVGVYVKGVDMGLVQSGALWRLTAWDDQGGYTIKTLPGTTLPLELEVDERPVAGFIIDAAVDDVPYVLQDVCLIPVPEPGSFSMLMVGCVLLGGLYRGTRR